MAYQQKIMAQDVLFDYVAITFAGLEQVLAEELKELGAQEIQETLRAVTFRGDKKLLYKANIWCRTALRILLPIKSFPCNNEKELYEGVKSIEWENFITVNETIAVDAGVAASNINHSKYAALKTKDAVVDRFREKFDKRPDVDVIHPDLRINIRISKNNCIVSLDSSGEILFKRGYRKKADTAPMNEVLAAGLILLSGWDRKSNFTDFMCGSGTLVIEAALIAKRIPPGIFRDEFAFEKWKDFDNNLMEEVLEEAHAMQIKDLDFEIVGNDISGKAIGIADDNVRSAKLGKTIKLVNKDFKDFIPPAGGGTVIVNPPYGERIGVNDIISFYREIGDVLKQNYQGYDAWIFTANIEAAKFIGLKPTRKIPLDNGALECKFMKYSIYEGTKKIHKLEGK